MVAGMTAGSKASIVAGMTADMAAGKHMSACVWGKGREWETEYRWKFPSISTQ